MSLQKQIKRVCPSLFPIIKHVLTGLYISELTSLCPDYNNVTVKSFILHKVLPISALYIVLWPDCV